MAVSWRKHRVILKKNAFWVERFGTNHERFKWVGDTLNMDSYECNNIIRAIVVACTLPFLQLSRQQISFKYQFAPNTAMPRQLTTRKDSSCRSKKQCAPSETSQDPLLFQRIRQTSGKRAAQANGVCSTVKDCGIGLSFCTE